MTTIFGSGSNPKPDDETYLALLKGSVKPKVKIKLKKGKKDDVEVNVNTDNKSSDSSLTVH